MGIGTFLQIELSSPGGAGVAFQAGMAAGWSSLASRWLRTYTSTPSERSPATIQRVLIHQGPAWGSGHRTDKSPGRSKLGVYMPGR